MEMTFLLVAVGFLGLLVLVLFVLAYERLGRIERSVVNQTRKESRFMKTMSEAVAELKSEVEEVKGAEASAKTLIEGIAARIEAAAGNPDEILALTAELKAATEPLAAAVAANQPVPPSSNLE